MGYAVTISDRYFCIQLKNPKGKNHNEIPVLACTVCVNTYGLDFAPTEVGDTMPLIYGCQGLYHQTLS